MEHRTFSYLDEIQNRVIFSMIMMMKNSSISTAMRHLWSLVPLGGSLPDDVWQSRHRFMVGLTWFHAILIALVGPAFGYSWEFSLQALFHKDTVLHTIAKDQLLLFLQS